MGHSAQRPSSSSSPSGKPQKRLELLPEEALYLVEKGALFCWKASGDGPGNDVEWDTASQGAPMSVQQAYAEMIGKQDLTLDRYLVSAVVSSLPLDRTRLIPRPRRPKDFFLPSPPRLHRHESEAAVPRLSRSRRVPNFTAASHAFDFP